MHSLVLTEPGIRRGNENSRENESLFRGKKSTSILFSIKTKMVDL